MPKLDLQTLIRNNQPIYVRNRTGEYLDKQGPYVLEIREAGKQAYSIVIPATKYPFHLSAHVPAKLLSDSTEFYGALSKKILVLVDPDEAELALSDPIAQQVVDNAMRKFQPTKRVSAPPPELVTANNRNEGKNLTPPGADTGISGMPKNDMPLKVAESPDAQGATSEVSASVVQVVMDLNSDPDLREEKFLELAAMEGLTDDDFGYLLGNCQKFPKITQWARKELADLVGEDAVEDLEVEQAADRESGEAPRRRRKRRKK